MEHTLSLLALSTGIISLLCLVSLHFTSPEFQPSWRMISEYALGKFDGLITAFFLLWGACSILLAILLWNEITTVWGTIGVVLLLVSAIGQIMGGLFDLKHKLHGLAFLLGVPALPIAALLISYNLIQLDDWSQHKSIILLSAHSTWISLVLMGVAMGVMMSGFKKAGLPMEQNAPVPDKVPEGVIALAGYANRLLVLSYVLWLIVVVWVKE
ncbi:MAG TPA: DUF998 domain-containing protein [Saprospiraceae bacterium]